MVSNSLGFGNPFQNILLEKKTQISPSCIFQFPPFSMQVHNLSSVKNMFKHQVYPYIVCSKPPFFFVKSQFGFVNWLPPIMDMFVSSPYSMAQLTLGIPKFQTHPLVTPKLPKPSNLTAVMAISHLMSHKWPQLWNVYIITFINHLNKPFIMPFIIGKGPLTVHRLWQLLTSMFTKSSTLRCFLRRPVGISMAWHGLTSRKRRPGDFHGMGKKTT